ncbi:hypothetical protein BDR26DRAFT_866323 [Obelidium mucronatum]|nr:hypothetical protein BDR26DRAFT_866323 [Obelidium mucronatum]
MINPLPIIASASQHLHQDLDYFGSIVGGWIPDTKKDNIFCSELVATIYRRVGFETFKTHGPETFTPLEIQAVPEFDGIVYYAKENKNLLLKNGGTTLGANPVVTRCQQVVHGLRLRENWVKMPPSGGVPANAHKAGIDTDGVALYIARVKIGSSYRIGKIRADQKAPWIGYCKREIPIKYGHEVMVNLEETVWEEAENGNAPPHAVEAGVEEDGTIFYVARAHVGASGGFLGFGEDDGGWSVGACAPNLKGASLPYDGEEVHVTKYQVLCHKQ